jgi:hypothetical protein
LATGIAFSHDCIILDACCVINLNASGRMVEVLETIPKAVAVATYVRDVEALRIYGGPAGDPTSEYESIDLQPLVDRGLLQLVSPNSEAENISLVNFAAALGDDGEAITGAIALHRNWSIGSDDRKAINFFRREAPQLQLVTTPELIKHWVDTAAPPFNKVRSALQQVRLRARYEPSQRHLLYTWWQAYVQIT